MTNTPLVSVIIPSYNCSLILLKEAIESVIHQSWSNLEIILIDDGSADAEIARTVATTYEDIKIIRHSHNLGGGAARNAGIDCANGDFIAFLDADDLWLPGKLTAQIGALSKSCADNPEQMIYSASNCLLERGGKRKPCNSMAPPPDQPLWRYFILDGCSLQTSTLILPIELARAIRFRPSVKRHQDWDFVINLQQSGAQLLYLEECLSVYRLIDDKRRITRNPLAAHNSVIWFKEMVEIIPASIMQRHFFMHVVSLRSLRAPWPLIKAVCGAISLSPTNAFANIWGALRGRINLLG